MFNDFFEFLGNIHIGNRHNTSIGLIVNFSGDKLITGR